MGPTLEPLEYTLLSGLLGKPHGCPLTRTVGVAHTGASTPPPLLPHLHIIEPANGCIYPLVGRNRAGLHNMWHKWEIGGIPGL